MTCTCGSTRIALVEGKCSDMCCAQIGGKEKCGYVPSDMGIGSGDYITVRFCLDCGRIQGNFPIPLTDLESGKNEDDDY